MPTYFRFLALLAFKIFSAEQVKFTFLCNSLLPPFLYICCSDLHILVFLACCLWVSTKEKRTFISWREKIYILGNVSPDLCDTSSSVFCFSLFLHMVVFIYLKYTLVLKGWTDYNCNLLRLIRNYPETSAKRYWCLSSNSFSCLTTVVLQSIIFCPIDLIHLMVPNNGANNGAKYLRDSDPNNGAKQRFKRLCIKRTI